MKRLFLLPALVLLGLHSTPSHAQSAFVVADCAAVSAIPVGPNQPLVQDQTGKLCGMAGASGTTSATNLTQVNSAAVNVGTGAASTGTQRVTTSTDSTIGTVTTITNPVSVSAFPTTTAANANTASPATITAAVSNAVICAAACNLYGFQANTGAASGFVLLFNATSAPADGAVTPVKFWQIAANSTLGVDVTSGGVPVRLSTGATLVFSTTGPLTKTASATAYFSGEAK